MMTADRSLLRRTALLSMALSAVLGLQACGTKTSDRDLVPIEPEAAKAEMMKMRGGFGSKVRVRGVYLDPRDRAAFDAGHIPGALNLPMADLEGASTALLRDYDVIVVYDTDYGDVLAKAASKRLIELGHRNVQTLKGGLTAWKRDGNPVETGDGAPADSNAG